MSFLTPQTIRAQRVGRAVHKMSARPRVLLVATLICGHAVCDGLALPQPRRWSHLVRDRLTEHSALLERARQLQAEEVLRLRLTRAQAQA